MNNQEIAIAVVSKVTGVAKSTILSSARQWSAVEARQFIVLLLHREGASDECIAWILRRSRTAVLKARHNASDMLRLSSVFRAKFSKISEIYEYQKSIRVS